MSMSYVPEFSRLNKYLKLPVKSICSRFWSNWRQFPALCSLSKHTNKHKSSVTILLKQQSFVNETKQQIRNTVWLGKRKYERHHENLLFAYEKSKVQTSCVGCGDHAADHHLRFHSIDSTIHLFSKSKN